MVTEKDVLEFMYPDSQISDAERTQAKHALTMAISVVDNYTRGRHLDATGATRPGVDAVVLTVAARMLANPGQVNATSTTGSVSDQVGRGFQGLTLGETIILDRWRTRSAHG